MDFLWSNSSVNPAMVEEIKFLLIFSSRIQLFFSVVPEMQENCKFVNLQVNKTKD